jgi:hypothetical protein
MVVTVKVTGLNIVKARGKWYVYLRATGERLLGPIEGERSDVIALIEEKPFVAKWNSRRPETRPRSYEDGTLGALVLWFETECPKYQTLSDATKKDYTAAFAHLRGIFDTPLDDFTTADLYELRDQCAKEKWPRFADKMISAISSMFTQAVKRRKMKINPALGIDKAHTSDPNANREWYLEEWDYVRLNAPRYLLTPMMIARHAGYRGQTIVKLRWNDYGPHPQHGWKCLRKVARKNNERTMIPVVDDLQDHLDGLERTALEICTRQDGTPWDDEKQMQTAVSHYLRDLERDGHIRAGTTLHGLRTTYAADLKRHGADTGDVAAALGDKSERMGAHYTRHVENEAKVIRAFASKNKR